MPKLLFAWLGSGRTKRSHVGDLGRYLDQAARAGLPVPPGTVLLDEFYRFALENQLAERLEQHVVCPDPLSLHATIFDSLRLPSFDRLITVKAICEQRAEKAKNQAAIDSRDPGQMAHALAGAWTALEQNNAGRRDVLLCEVISATCSGTAVSRIDDECDQLTFAASPLAGYSAQEKPQAIDRLSGWRLPDSTLPPHIQRLQMLLRGVRRTMEPGDWIVKWADDGAICWLVELRRETVAQL